MQLLRKSKWPEQCEPGGSKGSFNVFPGLMTAFNSELDNIILSFDFNPSGELVATIDCNGVCLVSNVNTDSCSYHVNMGQFGKLDFHSCYLFLFNNNFHFHLNSNF